MGCIFNKSDEAEVSLSPNTQRYYLLKFALQNSKSVKYTGFPELTEEEQAKLAESSKEYMSYVESSNDKNHFSDLIAKHPNVFHTYFRNVPVDSQCSSIEVEDEGHVAKIEFTRHIHMSTLMIKNCIVIMTEGETDYLEDALRRIGSIHAESWVNSKDVLYFEDSFMWMLDKYDSTMNVKLKLIWRKAIKYIVHNIVIGINNHYQKLSFALGQDKRTFICFDIDPPAGVDPKSHESLRKIQAHMKAQEDS